MRTDYKTPLSASRRHHPNPHWRLRSLALTLGLAVLGMVMASTQEPGPGEVKVRVAAQREASQQVTLQQERLELPRPGHADGGGQASAERNGPALSWRTLTVERGDTLAGMLSGAGVPRRTIHVLTRTGEHGRSLSRLRPGEEIRVGLGPEGDLQRLEHITAPDRRLVFDREGEDAFAAAVVEEPLQRRLEHARGVIDTSLFEAGAEAGLDNRLIMDLAGIFGWDIDFVLDIRRGDRFTVVYEAFYKDGRHVRDGEIVAAEFVNDGHAFRAVRYTDPGGDTDYYAPDGSSMRKAFLRSPVKFTRISSRYGSRYHPILGKMRDHHGVDYAAPSGTPIRSTGDGVIVFRGRNGGYGKFVVVRHGNRYSTAYGHLHGFARGQGVGSRVEQGEIIGYVGNTGLSTGPHLHYEFRVHGVHKNPLKVEFPSVEPIPDDERQRFRERIAPRLAQLDTLERAYAALER